MSKKASNPMPASVVRPPAPLGPGGFLVDPQSEEMKKLMASLVRTRQRRRCRCHCHDYPDGVVKHMVSCCGGIKIIENPALPEGLCFMDNSHGSRVWAHLE